MLQHREKYILVEYCLLYYLILVPQVLHSLQSMVSNKYVRYKSLEVNVNHILDFQLRAVLIKWGGSDIKYTYCCSSLKKIIDLCVTEFNASYSKSEMHFKKCTICWGTIASSCSNFDIAVFQISQLPSKTVGIIGMQ